MDKERLNKERLNKERMNKGLSRREALKLGTSAAISAVAAPMLGAKNVSMEISRAEWRSASPDGMAEATDELCFMRAVDVMKAIREKKVSAREVMQAHLKQIQLVNGKVNAIVTLVQIGRASCRERV